MTYTRRQLVSGSTLADGRKRIFIGLFCATCLLVCLCLFLFLILPWLSPDPGYLRHASIGLGLFGIFLLGWLCLSLVFHIYTGKSLPYISGIRHVMIRIFLPLMELAGRPFGIDKSMVRRSFIKINNEFVLSSQRSVRPDQLLLLLPHCIQSSKCPRRLTGPLDNCAHCGKCQIGALRALAETRGFMLAIATGGTIARRIVVECKPKCIVAVACERDLTSGIQDSYPLPVFGILNERPHGPCRDTVVPMELLEQAINLLARPACPITGVLRKPAVTPLPLK